MSEPWSPAAFVPMCVVACTVGCLIAASTPALAQEGRFEQLRIVDAQGRVRGYFGVDASGRAVSLSLLDSAGKSRIVLGVGSAGDAPSIGVIDRRGRTRQVQLQPSERLAPVREPDSKADDVGPQQVRNLQAQIDTLRAKVNQLVDQMNAPR
jgi:hypothetical protein